MKGLRSYALFAVVILLIAAFVIPAPAFAGRMLERADITDGPALQGDAAWFLELSPVQQINILVLVTKDGLSLPLP